MPFTIKHGVSLQPLNTLGVNAVAEEYCLVTSVQGLAELLAEHRPMLILGSGSNLLFVDERLTGLVLQPRLTGIKAVSFDSEHVLVTAHAGEDWHQLVLWCLGRGYGGLENLSLIPGSVGAAPVQNIGAYGVALADTLYQVETMNMVTGDMEIFTNSECRFTYRDSVFKSGPKSARVIVSVSFLLTKKKHRLNTSYAALGASLHAQGICHPGIQDISRTVIHLRQKKLPDPAQIPNAGSFFKNPVISDGAYREIFLQYPDMPGFRLSNQTVKIPAGWLIEQCGWRGFRGPRAGVHDQHALVLVNHSGASGLEIYDLSAEIIDSVAARFGIILQREVHVIPCRTG